MRSKRTSPYPAPHCARIQAKIQAGNAPIATETHLTQFLQFAENAAPLFWGRDALAILDLCEAEHANLRIALQFALDTQDIPRAVQLAGALGDFWHLHNHTEQAERWYAQMLPHLTDDISPAHRARLLSGAGTIAWDQSNFAYAQELHRRALALYETIGDAHGIALSLNNIGVQSAQMGNLDQAETISTQALQLARSTDDQHCIVFALNSLGFIALGRKQFEPAEQFLNEGLELAKQNDDANSIASIASNLAEAARLCGDFSRADAMLKTALACAHTTGNFRLTHFLLREWGSVLGLQGDYAQADIVLRQALELAQLYADPYTLSASYSRFAWLAGQRGNPKLAAQLWGFAYAGLEQFSNVEFTPAQAGTIQAILDDLRWTLGDDAFEREWAFGKALTEPQAAKLVYAPEEERPLAHS